MHESSEIARFRLLDPSRLELKRRWLALGAGLAAQVVLLALVAGLALLSRPAAGRFSLPGEYLVFQLPRPAPESRRQPPATVKLPVRARRAEGHAEQPNPPRLEMPRVTPSAQVPLNRTLLVAPPRIPPRAASSPEAAARRKPNRGRASVRIGVFGRSPTPAMVRRPASQVQTGGFGDSDGFRGEASPGSAGNVPKVGTFDLPAGPGKGNGSGGSRGVIGTVRSAGFRDAAGSPDGGVKSTGSHPGDQVRQGGFGDVVSAARRPPAPAPTQSVSLLPVEILSKPAPAYTEEARRLRIEGEVTVEVLFAASGQLRVLRVVNGLGHGLDEAALRAAAGIRFKPARRDGQAVDTAATLHIIFQLAT